MQQLIKKSNSMARQLRKQSATGIHHVILRGINRQMIFEDTEDYRVFIHYLHQVVRPKDEQGQSLPAYATFYAFCLMTNHVHLLIREGAENLSSSVKRIAAAYARYYNNNISTMVISSKTDSRVNPSMKPIISLPYYAIYIRILSQQGYPEM